jgi:hydrogenase maturation protease
VLIGVQPAEIDDYGGSLRPIVDAAIEPAMAVAVEELKSLGATVTRRQAPVEALGPDALDRALYETERPSAAEACRIGDARFLDIQAGD